MFGWLILTFGVLEVDSHQRTEVAIHVHEGEVEPGESAPGDVIDGPDVFYVRGVFSLARHPHRIRLQRMPTLMTVSLQIQSMITCLTTQIEKKIKFEYSHGTE